MAERSSKLEHPLGAKGKGRESDPSIEEDCRIPDVMDFISQMPDGVLVNILSRLPLKQAVTTGVLSPRWRFVWHSLENLDFVGTKTLAKMNRKHLSKERAKYINQVNSVIGSLRSHSSPMVKSFEISFNLDKTYFKDIDNWLGFALDKKVEVLTLEFCENGVKGDTKQYYNFPLPLSDGSMVRLSECPSSSSMVVDTLSFKKLNLLGVNVSDVTLKLLLKNSPHLETLYIFGGGLLTDVTVGGWDINMKNFVLMGSAEIQSVSLHDFDLEEFHFNGLDAEIRLTNLPKLKEVDIGMVSVGLNNKVFSTISSVASYLEVLSLTVDREREDIEVEAIPKLLPNVKTLKLTLPTQKYDSLMDFIEIAKKCPKLETFIVSLYWSAPINGKNPWPPLGHSFPHLKYLEIVGYRGIVSDYQIVLYMIGNAAGTLKKIVIDPSIHPYDACFLTANASLKI
ncbi:F-box domain containing protein [Tanacetum coccineum]